MHETQHKRRDRHADRVKKEQLKARRTFDGPSLGSFSPAKRAPCQREQKDKSAGRGITRLDVAIIARRLGIRRRYSSAPCLRNGQYKNTREPGNPKRQGN